MPEDQPKPETGANTTQQPGGPGSNASDRPPAPTKVDGPGKGNPGPHQEHAGERS